MSGAYRMRVPIEVRFRDTDAMGHVNNAVYFTYLEAARNAYWFHVVGGSSERDLGFILARAECDFRAAVKFGEALEVGVRVAEMGRSSFVMEYELVVPGSARVVATAKTVQVSYDYATARTRPLPDATREAIERFERSS
ncbi:MAG: acyl-CoA thioesterase [Deltaproteobacteria bacterium]|nr:acyl-CoA thioesterase [Deltaproteobacteria bacterium]